MLSSLSIRDFAIIDRLDVEFGAGFVVVTGETGAGKSILVNALHLLLGGRASDDMIREGAESAEVQGLFRLPEGSPVLARLEQLGLADGDVCNVRRVIQRAGRNRVFINDRSVNLTSLMAATRSLVDISGQHEHVGLTEEETHCGILDAFGDLGEQTGVVADAVGAWRRAQRALAEVEAQERQRTDRQELVRFQLDRIDAVNPLVGEDEKLEAERLRLANAEKLIDGLQQAVGWLYEQDGCAVELAGRADKLLASIARFDPQLMELIGRLQEGLRTIEDVARDLADRVTGLASDPDRLEQIEQRLQALRGLKRMHGPDLQNVLERRAELAAELEELANIESRKVDLARQRDQAMAKALESAALLSKQRQQVAKRLAERLGQELAGLAMPGARFEVEVQPGGPDELTDSGLDQVRFLFTANPGEPVRPLARVASGGELSRVLLALKGVLAEVDPVALYVFDEVDSGVGGAVAEVIGGKLAAVASGHQVLCITHLPQIATHAASHYTVHKRVRQGRTVSGISRLETQRERIEEIARMVGGRQVTEKARTHARDMLARARRPDSEGA